jgi:hypothetical protein
MFAHRNRLRIVAVRVLLAWVLALATSFANACMVDPVLHQLGQPALGSHSAHVGHPGHNHDHSGHAGGSSHDHEHACDKFCDEASAGVQNPKPKVDPANGSWLAIPLAAAATTVPPAATAIAPANCAVRWRPLPPVPLVFLRLTL